MATKIIYHQLKTKKIPFNLTNTDVSEEMVIDAIEHTFSNIAFSTFPFYFEASNSYNSIKNFNSGNCVAMAFHIKKIFKENHNIDCFLIPATIPHKYQVPGYLDIAHVAVAIPINKTSFFIADPAFYFLNPIKLDITNNAPQLFFSKKIYTKELNTNLLQYNSIDKIYASTKRLERKKTFNKHQSIQGNTYYSECYSTNTPTDKWSYYLIEVLNPEEAISSFFYSIKNKPFICTTKIDNNGIPYMDIYITIKDGTLSYSKNFEDEQTFAIDTINPREISEIDRQLSPFFRGNLANYLKLLK
tara:strand:+ start:68 stop:970 length:903 start_codon:yes stop_codon:yes gene_type:complete